MKICLKWKLKTIRICCTNIIVVSHLNLRSIKSNLESFIYCIEGLNLNLPIIGVSETWLTDSNSNLCNITGHNFTEKHRTEKTGGGVWIFCQISIQYTIRDDLSLFNEYLESICIEIPSYVFHMGQTRIIGTICRPPGMDLSQFNTLLEEILSKIQMGKESLLFFERLWY